MFGPWDCAPTSSTVLGLHKKYLGVLRYGGIDLRLIEINEVEVACQTFQCFRNFALHPLLIKVTWKKRHRNGA